MNGAKNPQILKNQTQIKKISFQKQILSLILRV